MSEIIMQMREGLRDVIHKFPAVYRICCIFVREYGKIYYYFLNKNYGYTDRLRELKDTKKGKRCFIIGNGPSLRASDLDMLVGEDCFSANRIFKIFPSTQWRPTYYTVDDWHGINNKEADELELPSIFFGDYFYRKHRIKNKNVLVFYGYRTTDLNLESFKFSDDISKRVYIGATVTFVNMQIAAYMGYKEIYLLGIDHTFAVETNNTGVVIKNESIKQSHFFKDESTAKVIGNIEGMTNAYITAKQYADTHGIKIYNATRGGKLEVFERVDFDELMKKE